MNSIKNWLSKASLKIDKLDAEVILLYVLKKNKIFLYTDSDYILSNQELLELEKLLQRRLNCEPVAYIIGHKEFWSLDFIVNKNVLIPRPDTELLVEKVLHYLPKDKNIKLADIGTGSGAIAISLAKERPNWEIYAVDISSKALDIAKQNAKKHNVKNIKFIKADLFSGFDKLNSKFDAIVSNPPYIDVNDEYFTSINKKELAYEPYSALIAKDNGLEIIKKLILESQNYLIKKGFLFIEHGFLQKESINKFLSTTNIRLNEVNFFRDLNKIDRLLVLQF